MEPVDSSLEYHASGKKRVRATQACIMCRKKKIKCDGTKPECLHCLEANITCEYSECRKRGPRKGYVQLLEERLAHLERRLSEPKDTSGQVSDDSADTPTRKRVKGHLTTSFFGGGPSGMDISLDIKEQDGEQSKGAIQTTEFLFTHGDLTLPTELALELVDLFFKHINSVFPIIYRPSLRHEISNGTASKPLLWAIMAISARFSDHPSLATDPPYWAGEKFAVRASSFIGSSTLEANIPNLQFWVIMGCLEFGRASGAKAWMYSGIALRMCEELGFNKEETLQVPVLRSDGSVDPIRTALRRRIYWCCVCIDKFASAGTTRPQYFDMDASEVRPPNVPESIILRDPISSRSIDGVDLESDSLMDVARVHLNMISIFGEVNALMSKIKSGSSTVVWPPSPHCERLDSKLRTWKSELDDRFQYTAHNVKWHAKQASKNYVTLWMTSHALWCATMLVLHRGSLAYTNVKPTDVSEDTYRRIQSSIKECKMCVDEAMSVFETMKDLCGNNVLPFMAYCAYIFATVMMTSTFSKDRASCHKSTRGLRILYEMIKELKPYWPMCERLALTTEDLLLTHSRLYDTRYQEEYPVYDDKRSSDSQTTEQMSTSFRPPPPLPKTSEKQTNERVEQLQVGYPPLSSAPSSSSLYMPPNKASVAYSYSATPNNRPIEASLDRQHQQQRSSLSNTRGPLPHQNPQQRSQQHPHAQSHLQQTHVYSALAQSFCGDGNAEVDFNSCEFLYDSALFGQIMFDTVEKAPNGNPGSYFPDIYSTEESALSYNPGMQQTPSDSTSAAAGFGSIDRPVWDASIS
ncbi:fungal-specific transcription factor domain-domain-containing protein [Syncephalastrum racemosum]|uniref:Fungal-specific transcription factor domain-domain-containing protein n=1 Tax=Syncephalastrum racemosum TaxID=13706 RepID=A0A1X2HPL8_SYNRA|nr:fungal-specific transcription factor domain-domain-containing protein [Syncephalastrum racemosum]